MFITFLWIFRVKTVQGHFGKIKLNIQSTQFHRILIMLKNNVWDTSSLQLPLALGICNVVGRNIIKTPVDNDEVNRGDYNIIVDSIFEMAKNQVIWDATRVRVMTIMTIKTWKHGGKTWYFLLSSQPACFFFFFVSLIFILKT